MKAGRHGVSHGPPGVVVREMSNRSLVLVEVRRGREHDTAVALANSIGLVAAPLPRTLLRHSSVTMAWAGPGLWMIAEDGSASALVPRLGTAIGSLASVVDQSDGRATLRLSGVDVRPTLAKGVSVDLDRRQFVVGSVALTKLVHLAVQLWHVDGNDTFDLIVPRTSAGDIWHWLEASAAEYGLEVVSPA